MMNKMKKTLIAAAVAATVGMSSQAMAGAVAYSYLELTNVQLFNVTENRQAAATDFTNLNIGASSETSATSSFGPGAVNSNPLAHDALLSCSGNCGGIGQNIPGMQGQQNFGRSDTFGDGGFLVTGLGPLNSANVWTMAEGRQDQTGFTTGQSNALSSTQFAFTLGVGTTFQLNFDADGELFTQLHQNEVQAIAGFGWSASIVEILAGGVTGDTVFSWTPNGAAGGISGGTELVDAFNMNTSRSVLSTGTSAFNPAKGFFSAETILNPGQYRFTINHTSNINTVATKVPEPATLALLAAGLGMLGFARRRKQA